MLNEAHGVVSLDDAIDGRPCRLGRRRPRTHIDPTALVAARREEGDVVDRVVLAETLDFRLA